MAKKQKKIAVSNAAAKPAANDPFLYTGARRGESDARFWRWGDDNMFPYALALMARRSTTHRRIINDKADYISGKGFAFDPSCERLARFVESVNGAGESMRQLVNKLAFDKALFGNAFVEVITDAGRTFLSLFHHDASKCRIGRDHRSVVMHHDWRNFSHDDAQTLPLYPAFAQSADGTLRSVVHYKDYEPMFENYGVPPYIAGMNVSAIAYKTDRWNISRLDNSFQLSGVMMLDGTTESEAEAERVSRMAAEKFAGKPGQVMFVMKDCGESDNSKFIPITSANDGDWRSLHEQATSDIVVAHSWFRSLSGLDYSSGWSADRILHEYEVALNTVILSEQEELLEPLRQVISLILGCDCSSLEIINRPPKRSKPLYMRIWEARKAEGLEYDPSDEKQQLFVAQITKYALQNID
ncbi:MAG: phage portal protein [Rikenellaceae bacterium]|nr:phage portal protein [Rikenellaceae bacterium]MCL2692314.1 phage portal protein [Rikenellaceae bacterium]